MNLFRAALQERIKRTETVESFRFVSKEKPAFLPGQFLQVIFDETNPNNRDLNKYLSFSSSPDREYFEVTKRLSESRFSERLTELPAGQSVLLKGPMGNCNFQEDYRKIGVLIGGIGITPVVSILEYIAERNLDTDGLLFYSNRVEEEIAFRPELDRWQKRIPKLKVFYLVTECPPKNPACLYGRIDNRLLAQNMADISERVVFAFGPPQMVKAMKELALNAGCPEKQIKTEFFAGY